MAIIILYLIIINIAIWNRTKERNFKYEEFLFLIEVDLNTLIIRIFFIMLLLHYYIYAILFIIVLIFIKYMYRKNYFHYINRIFDWNYFTQRLIIIIRFSLCRLWSYRLQFVIFSLFLVSIYNFFTSVNTLRIVF